MTGLLVWSAHTRELHPHDRVVFDFDGGTLCYRNMRRFGGVWLAGAATDRSEVTGPLGPDALDVSDRQLAELLGRRRGQIKPALMDQRLIAGLGNLLSDELLWRARIHPRRPACRLSPARVRELHRCMVEVLRDANRHARVPPIRGWLTGARDHPDARCPRCRARLRRATIGGRTAVWCPRCQR